MNTFYQTQSWMDFQRSLGRTTFRYDHEDVIAHVVKHETKFDKNFLYVPYGPNKVTDGFIEWLRDLARDEKSMFVKVEPTQDDVARALMKHGFRHMPKTISPYKTAVLDLAPAHDQLLAAMHHKTRYNIKVATKHEVTVQQSNDIEAFIKLVATTARRDKFGIYPLEYYEKFYDFFNDGDEIQSQLWLAYYKDQPIAGALLLLYGDIAYYVHGASDNENRNVMAPYALHWEIVKMLQATGYKFYDLWGIDDKKYPGVTRFKLSWGSRVVEYPGSFDMDTTKIWALLYRLFR